MGKTVSAALRQNIISIICSLLSAATVLVGYLLVGEKRVTALEIEGRNNAAAIAEVKAEQKSYNETVRSIDNRLTALWERQEVLHSRGQR